MFEVIMTLFSTIFTVRGRPYLTFFIRASVLSILTFLIIILSKVWGSTLLEFYDSLILILGVSIGVGVFLSLFQEFITWGGDDKNKH